MPLYNVVLIWIALGVVTLTVDRLYIRSLRPAKARQRAPGVPVSDHAREELCVSHAAIVATLPDSIRADFMPPVTVVSGGKIISSSGGYIAPSSITVNGTSIPWAHGWTPIYQTDRVRQAKEAARETIESFDQDYLQWREERHRCPDCIHPGCTGCLGRG